MRYAIAATLTLALVFFGFEPAQAQRAGWPQGSWQASCRAASLNGAIFSAQCTAANGAWRSSSIDLNRCPGRLVGNNNGMLFCEGGQPDYGRNLPGGSWRQSCRNATMTGNVVYAACSAGSGYRNTSFAMRNCPGWALGNSNGNLFCESGNSGGDWGRPGHFPGGSWVNSCGNARISGTVFYAQCSTGNGYRATQIDLRSCPSRTVGNRNGFLFCER
ncbi:MAG TPA: CVNH domain-containing protein [Candidatus Acidoferrales bacterium]|nr:CVNH domain-containing protein [Candidatus Acidoferrales bacterium]